MKLSLLDLVACPGCGSSLALRECRESAGEVESGRLQCAACPAAFPIHGFIPRFVPEENYASSFGFEWNRFRTTQLDSHTGVTISRDRFLRETGWTAGQLRGRTVLDAGCGAGRFTEVALSLGARVIAVDYSGAVDACWQNLAPHPNLEIVQADIYGLPFHRGRFDFVYCLGVLQNLPDPHKAVLTLPDQLRAGGCLAVDVYRKHWKSMIHPRHLIRPFSTRMSHARLLKRIERCAPSLLWVSCTVGRVPILGPLLRRLVPIANYQGIFPLSKEQLLEFAVLDTFDWLSPVYDQPQRDEDLLGWLRQAGLEGAEVLVAGQLVGRGRKGSVSP